MIVRKLRLQRGWTQSELAEMTDVTVRTIQRIESGHKPSMETCKALAAVFEVDFSTFISEGENMDTKASISYDEQVAIVKAKGKKSFYEYLGTYLFFAAVFLPIFHGEPVVYYVFGGMAVGIMVQGLIAFEIISFISPKAEKNLVERDLNDKL